MNSFLSNVPQFADEVKTTESVSFTEAVCNFLNVIEGWKTRIKNLHWSAPKMNTHKLLDDIANTINSYQDGLAEEEMGESGKFAPNMLKGIQCDSLNITDLLSKMLQETYNFHTSIPEGPCYSGMKSETETFIHNLKVFVYLSNLCDVNPY